jgi:hypothetical protein
MNSFMPGALARTLKFAGWRSPAQVERALRLLTTTYLRAFGGADGGDDDDTPPHASLQTVLRAPGVIELALPPSASL